MNNLEAKIKYGLADKGIKCQSIYTVPTSEDTRVVIAFNSKDNRRLSVKRVESVLSSLNVGDFKILSDFQRLSSAFLHLEVTFGAGTKQSIGTPAS
ncbi:hypothetical protein EU527_12810 [Candidatus Thorarchaeota archaeon]|nr:MAG: hypothetical protein EU527_12810 [Candidatus Thorarchaeota archaeon]